MSMLGGIHSGQHDMMVYHPDGSIWSVDGPMDTLHVIRFDKNPDGDRTSYLIPRGDHKPGGVYAKLKSETEGPVKTYLAPHSLQTAPDGVIWLTLASGNQLAGFDPKTEKWDIVDLEEGVNPHTLRFDQRGRFHSRRDCGDPDRRKGRPSAAGALEGTSASRETRGRSVDASIGRHTRLRKEVPAPARGFR